MSANIMGIIVMSTAIEASLWVTAHKITVAAGAWIWIGDIDSTRQPKLLMHILHKIAHDYIKPSG